MKELLINLKSVLPKESIIKGVTDYYQIDILEADVNHMIQRNNIKRLNQIAIEERELYSDWIAEMNEYFLDNKLLLNDDLSLFYLTDLSNKRTEIFNTFNHVCNIKLIKEIIDEFGYECILVNGGSDAFYESIKSSINKKIYKLNDNENFIKKFVKFNFKKSILFNYIRHLRLISRYLIYKLFLYPFLINSKTKSSNVGNLFFTRYPLHFKENCFIEEKYNFLVGKGDKFMTSIICDGLHQNISIWNAIKSRIQIYKKNNEKHIVIDDYINFKSILLSIFESISIITKFKKLLKKNYYYKDINLSKSIKAELRFSFQRVLALILNYRCIDQALSNVKSRKYIYYLHEYSFGRMISYTLHRKKRFNTVGFQHGPASIRKLLYNISFKERQTKEFNYLNSVPIPNKVIAEDENSKNIYLNSGYSNIEILKKIPRISYLYNLKINEERDIVLIASGLHDFEYVYKFAVKIFDTYKNENFVFKSHPRSNINFKKYVLPSNAEFSSEHISKLLVRAKSLYSTYSSVALEAKFLNIPVKLIHYPGTINQSPLND